MADPFLCNARTRCLSFSSVIPTHISSPKPLHGKLGRIQTPIGFPKPRPTLAHSSSQLDLISTTECSDGSVLFCFGDESEKPEDVETNSNSHVDDVAQNSELSKGLVGSDVLESEIHAVIDADCDAVSETSTNNYLAGGEETDHIVTTTADVTEASPVLVETGHTASTEDKTEASPVLAENAQSTNSEEEFTEGKAHRRHVSGVFTPTIVELHTVEDTSDGEDISAAGLRLSSSAALLPHPSKALTGGEDAYFVACQNWLGVADGVGHWSLEGTNPGLYARELMENCERFISDCKGIELTEPDEVLIRGAANTKSPGSSTVLVAYFDGQALHVANIGNSGFIIIRNGAVFKRSSPMVHEFNFPLQIERGVDPSEFIKRYQIDLDEGDVIITATDGLFDNLYEQEITSIVSKSLETRLRLQDTAEFLAISAQEVGQSTSRRSPFADAAVASGYRGYSGGKLDDVTIILSYVQRNPICNLQ